MMTCKECNATFETEKALHGHFRKHKLKIRGYYERHYPKACLLTNRKLPWKNGDNLTDYLSRDFLDQKCLETYFASAPTPERAKILLNAVESACKRHEIGMGQAEWASLSLSPHLRTFTNYFVYQNVVESLGFKTRFSYSFDYKNLRLPVTPVPVDDFYIAVDSREQEPYPFFATIRGKLGVGDYALAGQLFNDVCIERKSIKDFGGTLSGGFERFERELQRVRESKRYLIIMVESTLRGLFENRFYGRCQAPYLLHNMRTLIRKYSDCSQWVFPGPRYNCISLVPLFLLCGEKLRNIDLQLWVELNAAPPQEHEFTKADLLRMLDVSGSC